MEMSDTNRSTASRVRDLLSLTRSLDVSGSYDVADGATNGVDEIDSLLSFESSDGIVATTSGIATGYANDYSFQKTSAKTWDSQSTGRDMSSEVDRLATYTKWPHGSPMNPTTLARAGFFFTGVDDMVKCFSCNGKIRDWEFGDSAIGEHKRFFPKCRFVQGKDQQNQPLLLNQRSSEENSGAKAEAKSSKEDDLFNPKKDSKVPDNKVEISNELKSEYRRLLTFQDWPRTNPIQPRSLAKAGFYYTQTRDIVKCFVCGGEISNWKVADVPMTQHTERFPHCPFVQDENVGNEKLTTTDVMNAQHAIVYREPTTKPPPTQKSGSAKSQVPQTAKVLDHSSFFPGQTARKQLTRAQHPQFGHEAERLKTYKYWPPSAPDANLLAKAGFFHTGEHDNVKCFYCNGGLRNWEPCDDPWTEHAKWFPKCDWLLQQRGEPFVEYVIANFPVPNQNIPVQPPPAPAVPMGAGVNNMQGTARPVVNLNIEPPAMASPPVSTQAAINARMESDIVKFVVEMGFSKRKIRRIVERQINRNEQPFNSIQSLVDTVLAEPDEPEDNEEEEEATTGATAGGPEAKQLSGDDEEARAAEKTKMLELPTSSGLDENMASLKLGGGEPQPKPAASSNLEDESTLPASIQDELRELRDKRTCKICMDNEINVLFTPCGHLVACESCAHSIKLCPICRMPIKTCIKTYLS